MRYPQGRILVFCKAPEPGKVKTRLQGALSAQQCAELHARLARHTLQTAVDSRVAPVELWRAGDAGHPFFEECEQRYGTALRTQQGGNLGARMAQALQSTLRSSGFAIIIGTDCPVLDAAHLREAAGFLTGANDRQSLTARVVIAPATDGGYVLFGSDQAVKNAFENVDWGGAEVLRQTRDRLRNSHILYRELETLWDVDRPEDLQRLPAWLNAFQ